MADKIRDSVKPTGKGPAVRRKVPKSSKGSSRQRTKLQNSARYIHWDKTGEIDLSKPDGGFDGGAHEKELHGPQTGKDIQDIVNSLTRKRKRK